MSSGKMKAYKFKYAGSSQTFTFYAESPKEARELAQNFGKKTRQLGMQTPKKAK